MGRWDVIQERLLIPLNVHQFFAIRKISAAKTQEFSSRQMRLCILAMVLKVMIISSRTSEMQINFNN